MARRRESMMLCLIQCGQSTWDQENRVHGSTDLPLSETGRADIMAAAARMEPARGPVHHGPDEAAAETARIIAAAMRCRTRAVEELADPNLGLLEGLTERDFAERFPRRHRQWQEDPLNLSPPEGEDLADARARIFAAVARILRRGRGEEVFLVLHTLGAGFLRCWLADRPSRELWELVRDRPAVERYALTAPMIQWLEDSAAAAVSSRA
jgi:probable phosphoglycerate mutase